ncbi:MAG: leucyl aminopeptidase [Gemmatimonadetes bacterium]|nr:leucyl aminopeptidase [Gemmatimonadota bacterium]
MTEDIRSVRTQAELVVDKLLGVKAGEQLAVVTDAQTDTQMLSALTDAASEAGAEVTVLTMPSRETARKNDLGPVIEKALEGAQALIGLTGGSGAPSYAGVVTRLCAEKRLRYLSMVMRSLPHFTGGGALADYPALHAEGERLAARWRRAHRIHVTTPTGTDLRAVIEGEQVIVECGIASQPGARAAFADGEVSQMPKEGTAEGRIVVDGPMAHLGSGDSFHLAVKGGKVLAVGGAGPRATALRKILASVPNATNVAEVGIGLNPACRRNGDFEEEKKARGLVHVALGDNLFYGGKVKCGVHMDMVLYRPTVTLDGFVAVDDGRLAALG